MEDLNALAADCIVVSCCCQCLILQIFVFVLLRLPCKLIRKIKEYAKKKLRNKKREETTMQREMTCYNVDNPRISARSFRIEEGGLCISECHSFRCRMEEVEKVLEELSQRGEFSFGSFWCGDDSGNLPTSMEKQELDYNVVQYHLIEGFGSFCYL